MLIFIALWHLLVYCPVAHATWMTDGFLHKARVLDFAGGNVARVLDFAGGNVVHITAGFSGLVSSIVIGKRTGYGAEQFSAHNMLISVLGASLLWVGWCGFNGGSAGSPSPRASMAMGGFSGGSAGSPSPRASMAVLNTNVSAATASLSWM
ncbi:ammonium transporter AmtB-like domain-containing protein [Baffinella frigidus]|nr:ammonium transporter AmtB-like domain-containing protein [Cryptophyta sp. CCMP2293]